MENYDIEGEIYRELTPQIAVDRYVHCHFWELREKARATDGKITFWAVDSWGYRHGVTVDFHL